MPLDPNIILQSQVPQNHNPLEQYSRALALKNAIQQNQSGALELQQRQQDMADQQKMRKAYMDSGGDLEKLQQNAMQLGVGPNTLMKVKDQLLKQRETLASIDDKELTVKKAHTEAIGAAAQSLLQLPPEQRQAAYGPIVQQLAQQGRIKPGEVPAQYPGDEAMQLYANSARTSQQIIDSVLKDREVKAQEQSAGARATTAATGADKEKREAGRQAFSDTVAALTATPPKTPQEYRQRLGALPTEQAMRIIEALPIGQYDPATAMATLRKLAMTPEQQAQADQAAANASQTAQHNRVEEQQGAARIGISRQELGLRQQENDRKYGELTPDQKIISDKLSRGDYDPAQLGRLPGQDKEKIMAAAVLQAASEGRDWTPQVYAAKKDFTDPKGKQAQNLGTISRIVGHIGRFEENSKQMGFAPAYASGMTLTGSQAKLAEDSHAIAGELEKLVSGGVGSMEQTKAWQKGLRSPSGAARQQAIDEISQLIGSQYEGMNQTYKAAVGSDLPVTKYVSPAGQQWLKSKGINVAGAAQSQQAKAPAVGAIEDGHRFKGGNPADPKSWEKIN